MKRKQILIIIALIVVLAVAFFVVQKKDGAEYVEFPESIILSVDVNIDEDSRDFWEEKIEEYKIELEKEDLTNPDRISYLVALASNYESLGKYDLMLEAITEASVLATDSQAVQKTYSQMLYRAKDYSQALLVADLAINLKQDKPLPWLWRLELEEQLLKKKKNAIELYEKALNFTAHDIDIMIAYAEFLERIEKPEMAVAVWKDAQTRHPEMSEAFESRIERINK